MSRGSWLLAMIVLPLFPFTASASTAHQIHPNLARGSGDARTVSRHGPDGVNLFNGNLSLALPLGVQYPLARDFGYQLSLHYNSNAWDMSRTGPSLYTASPGKLSNAGFGWDLSLGRLVGRYEAGNELLRWVYVGPDGTMHPFYDTLHQDIAEFDDFVFYTRDGSYLRLKEASGVVTVESPDGVVRTFTLFGDGWKLTRIADRFSSHLSISYGPDLWTLTDNHGRTHTVHFRADPSGVYAGLVDRVVLAAFGGTSATYTFAYTTGAAARPDTDNDPATPSLLNVPLLESVAAPDGSKHSFVYGWRVPSAGRLMSAVLPTLGRIDWTYRSYSFTSPGCPTSLNPALLRNYGVAGRYVSDAAGTVLGTWSFTPALNPSTAAGVCSEEREFSNTVETPLRDRHVHYFSVNTKGAGPLWKKSDYGLPGTRNAFDPGGTRALARRTFDCDEAGGNCQQVQSRYARHEQDAEPDPANADVAVSTNRREASERIVYHNDVENGVERFADTDRSDFDGLGHYRRTTTGGNFGRGDLTERFVNYNAASGTYRSASYAAPPPSAAWVLNISSQIKVVEGQSSQTVELCYDRDTGFLSRRRNLHSSAPTGAASSRDVVVVYTPDAAGQPGTEQYYGGDNQWVGTASLCSLSIPVTDQYQLRRAYQYGVHSGSRYYTSAGQQFGPRFFDRDIDRNTGLASAGRDAAGITTQYEYDAMGRPTWVKPAAGHGAWTEHRYTAATGNSLATGARKTTYQYPNGGGAALTYHAEVRDAFGRVAWEQKRMPDGSYPERHQQYNALGGLTQSSEYNAGAPRHTLYLHHDPFGRARTIRPPDGSHHDITVERAGFRKVRRAVPTGVWYSKSTGAVTEQPRAVTQIYDRQNRLWKELRHTVDRFGAQRDIVTEYFYDVAGGLVETKVDGARRGSLHTRDGRGFLASDFHDSGNGNVTVSYLNNDAFGLPRRTQRQNHALNSVVTYDSAYDRAGRLTKVFDPGNTSKVWKELTYADANGVNDWRAGKLWKAKRLNDMSRFLGHHGITSAFVTETYAYGGPGGRLSRLETEFSDTLGRVERFAQDYGYTETGEVREVGYPSSLPGSSVDIVRRRRVTNAYADGLLTAVSGSYNAQPESWATSISYHPNGLVSQIAHGNGVRTNVARDADGFVRASSVTTLGARNIFNGLDDLNTGAFQYDGAGSLVRAGGEYFVPDSAAEPPPPPPPPPVTGSPCEQGWEDLLGMIYARGDDQCQARVFYYYTASDRLYKVENGSMDAGGKYTYFYDQSGRLLTEYMTNHAHYQPWPSTWEYTRDYVYRGARVLAVDEKRRDASLSTTFHYHTGFGAKGIRTDAGGYNKN